MRTEVRKIDESLRDALQARAIELSGLERLIGFAMSNTEYSIPQEKIDALMSKHAEVNAEYEILKQQVTNNLKNEFGPNTNWNLDFETSEATITIE